MSPRDSRLPAVAALVAVLAVAGIADRADRAAPPSRTAVGPATPTAAPADALASTWYCPAGAASAGAVADATVVIFNPSDQEITGSMHVVGEAGPNGEPGVTGDRVLNVPARDRVAVRVADVAQSKYVSTLVQLDRGGAIVEHTVSGPMGESAGACATTASDQWYFADGATTRAASLIYSLYNPFPDDAIVDIAFTTDEGRSAPAQFQGVVVPAGQLVPLDVGTHVRRREHVSSVVRARRGRLVVEALQTHAGDGRNGVALTLGATSPGTSWTFVDGLTGPGYVEKLHLFNPGPLEARVAVDLVLDAGEAEPFDLRVPPFGRITQDFSVEPRVPKVVGHALVVHVDNGRPVVAQRTIDFGTPSPRSGFISDLGAPAPAEHWAFAAGGATSATDEWVSVLNASSGPVTVQVSSGTAGLVGPLPGLDRVVIARGKRHAIRIGDHIQKPEVPMLVDATAGVYVGRFLYRIGGVGVSSSTGVVRTL